MLGWMVAGLLGCSELWPTPSPVAEVPLATIPKAPAAPSGGGKVQILHALQREGGQLQTSRVSRVLMSRNVLGELASMVEAQLALPADLVVQVQKCGEINAFYDRSTRRIVLCEEVFEVMEAGFSALPTQEEFEDAVLGATSFVLLHEVGHALVHQLSLDNWASEENSADAIATWLLVSGGRAGTAFQGARGFAVMSTLAQTPYWDEHALSEQRFFNVMCLLYGADPGRFVWLVPELLPHERAQRCPGEWQALSATADRQLARWRKPALVPLRPLPR